MTDVPYNGLGSTMAIADDAGDVVRDYTYDVYGEVAGGSGSTPNEFDFAGQQSDDSTGLQYLRARYYDPATGVFISRDPLASGPGWLGNPHGYVDANPTNLVDPLGLDGVLGWDPNPCKLKVVDKYCGKGKDVLEQADKRGTDGVLSAGDVLAGIGKLIGEYLKWQGEGARGELSGAQTLPQMLEQFFIKADDCAGDVACSLAVSSVLLILAGLSAGHPALATALVIAEGHWTIYSALEQKRRQAERDRRGLASPGDSELEGLY